MRLLVKPLGRRLGRDRHQRRPVHVGIGDARQEVCRARAEGRKTNTRLAGKPALNIGHERRALLVARLKKMDFGIEDCL